MVIISQYMQILNHYDVHLTNMLYVNLTPMKSLKCILHQ